MEPIYGAPWIGVLVFDWYTYGPFTSKWIPYAGFFMFFLRQAELWEIPTCTITWSAIVFFLRGKLDGMTHFNSIKWSGRHNLFFMFSGSSRKHLPRPHSSYISSERPEQMSQGRNFNGARYFIGGAHKVATRVVSSLRTLQESRNTPTSNLSASKSGLSQFGPVRLCKLGRP